MTDCVVTTPETRTAVLCVVPRCRVPEEHLDWTGIHYDDCAEDCDQDHHPEDCPGCRPADAEHGLICHQDSRRLRNHLGANEGLRQHTRDCIVQHGQSCECPEAPHGIAWAWDALTAAHPLIASPDPSEGTNGKRAITDPEAERLAAILTLRDETRDVLGSWAATVAERHGMAGPADVQVFTDPQHHRHVGPDRRIVQRCESWLLRQIALVEGHESVADLYAELSSLMSRAHALAPWRPAPTHIDGIPCRCGACALHDHGDEVKCWSCGRAYTLEQYATVVKVMERRFGDLIPGARTTAGARETTLRLGAPRPGLEDAQASG